MGESAFLQQLYSEYGRLTQCFDGRMYLYRSADRLSKSLRWKILASKRCCICGHRYGGKSVAGKDTGVRSNAGAYPYPAQSITCAHIFKVEEDASLANVSFGMGNFLPLCGTLRHATSKGAWRCCHQAFDSGHVCIFPRVDGDYEVLANHSYAFLRRTIPKLDMPIDVDPKALAAHACFCFFNAAGRDRVQLTPGQEAHLKIPSIFSGTTETEGNTSWTKASSVPLKCEGGGELFLALSRGSDSAPNWLCRSVPTVVLHRLQWSKTENSEFAAKLRRKWARAGVDKAELVELQRRLVRKGFLSNASLLVSLEMAQGTAIHRTTAVVSGHAVCGLPSSLFTEAMKATPSSENGDVFALVPGRFAVEVYEHDTQPYPSTVTKGELLGSLFSAWEFSLQQEVDEDQPVARTEWWKTWLSTPAGASSGVIRFTVTHRTMYMDPPADSEVIDYHGAVGLAVDEMEIYSAVDASRTTTFRTRVLPFSHDRWTKKGADMVLYQRRVIELLDQLNAASDKPPTKDALEVVSLLKQQAVERPHAVEEVVTSGLDTVLSPNGIADMSLGANLRVLSAHLLRSFLNRAATVFGVELQLTAATTTADTPSVDDYVGMALLMQEPIRTVRGRVMKNRDSTIERRQMDGSDVVEVRGIEPTADASELFPANVRASAVFVDSVDGLPSSGEWATFAAEESWFHLPAWKDNHPVSSRSRPAIVRRTLTSASGKEVTTSWVFVMNSSSTTTILPLAPDLKAALNKTNPSLAMLNSMFSTLFAVFQEAVVLLATMYPYVNTNAGDGAVAKASNYEALKSDTTASIFPFLANPILPLLQTSDATRSVGLDEAATALRKDWAELRREWGQPMSENRPAHVSLIKFLRERIIKLSGTHYGVCLQLPYHAYLHDAVVPEDVLPAKAALWSPAGSEVIVTNDIHAQSGKHAGYSALYPFGLVTSAHCSMWKRGRLQASIADRDLVGVAAADEAELGGRDVKVIALLEGTGNELLTSVSVPRNGVYLRCPGGIDSKWNGAPVFTQFEGRFVGFFVGGRQVSCFPRILRSTVFRSK